MAPEVLCSKAALFRLRRRRQLRHLRGDLDADDVDAAADLAERRLVVLGGHLVGVRVVANRPETESRVDQPESHFCW